MTTYIIKTVFCSALFLLVFKLFLEKERMHTFNRLYLLSSLIFSFIAPLLTFEFYTLPVTPEEFFISNTSILTAAPAKPVAEINGGINLLVILPIIYLTITTLLLVRFSLSIKSMFYKILCNQKLPYQNARLVLLQEECTPHSFLKYIFLNEADYTNSKIENEILLHELTHVQQKHSLDLLFVEIVHALCWFNPFIVLYKKSIRLNHEFLADNSVLSTYNNTAQYQLLLLEKSNKQTNSSLASPFNFLLTKKRLIMMTKSTSRKVAILKQIAAVLSFTVIAALFSAASFAQVKPGVESPKAEIAPPGDGATEQELIEYDSTLKNMTTIRTLRSGKKAQSIDMSKCDMDRMAFIYKKMNKEQRQKRSKTGVVFVAVTTPPEKKSPTVTQLESWKNSKVFGIWLDGKRVENNELNKYKPSDFAHFFESKLMKNATNYGKHYYQIDLYTLPGYDEAFSKRSK